MSGKGSKDAERDRVERILERDRVDRARQAQREAAELQVAEGIMVNLSDTVEEPTPEWLEKGDVRRFTPKQPDGTVRVIRTVRRDYGSVITRMYANGILDDDEFQACAWYRRMHEIAGMRGKAASSQWSATSTVQRSPGEAGFGYVPTSHMIAEARDAYRGARNAITAFYVRFFEMVVINNVPLRRAREFARCRNGKEGRRFRDCVAQVLEFCDRQGIEFPVSQGEG